MAFKDLRDFIGYLEQRGELQRVPVEVDWKYEVAGWVQDMWDRKPGSPALLFENLKDHPGYRIFSGGLYGYGRIAAMMGLDPSTPPAQLSREYTERIRNPLKPVIVKTGPVHENVHTGDDVNLLEFPIPHWTPRDGGRFVGCWHGVVSKDMETGQCNIGMYRMMALDSKRSAIGFLPYSHIGHHFAQRVRRNEPLEIAVVIGGEEVIPMVAMTGVPVTYDEYDLAGSLRGAPMELVKCQTVDLEVPANAEIVIEGRILPYERVPEGPFSEHAGYHSSGVRMRPVIEITAITHRNNPIYRGYLNTKPPTESHLMKSICLSASALAMYETVGPEGVTDVFCPPEADSCSMAIIQMKPRYVGHSLTAGRAFLSACSAATYHKVVVMVDEDIDIYNYGEVLWAIATRTQGSRDYDILKYCAASRSDPSIPMDHAEFTDKVIIDATKKLDYPYVPHYGGHWAPVAYPPEEVMQLARLKRRILHGEVGAAAAGEVERMQAHLRGPFAEKWEAWRKKHYTITPAEQELERGRSYPGLVEKS